MRLYVKRSRIHLITVKQKLMVDYSIKQKELLCLRHEHFRMSVVEDIKRQLKQNEETRIKCMIEKATESLKEYINKNIQPMIVRGIEENEVEETRYETLMYRSQEGCHYLPSKYIETVLGSDEIKQLVQNLNKTYNPIKISLTKCIFGTVAISIKYRDGFLEGIWKRLIA